MIMHINWIYHINSNIYMLSAMALKLAELNASIFLDINFFITYFNLQVVMNSFTITLF